MRASVRERDTTMGIKIPAQKDYELQYLKRKSKPDGSHWEIRSEPLGLSLLFLRRMEHQLLAIRSPGNLSLLPVIVGNKKVPG